VSGDTTAGGLARLDWALADAPDAVMVELGANDGLRGLDPAETRRNLTAIVERLQAEHIPVMLAGMYAPPNLGEAYGQDFNATYP
ncbi:GDSL-type esterase/lipase family protein, partial [Planococcus sp. SIMBA_160]